MSLSAAMAATISPARAACELGSIADLASDGKCLHDVQDVIDTRALLDQLNNALPIEDIVKDPNDENGAPLPPVTELLDKLKLPIDDPRVGPVLQTLAVLGQTVTTAGFLASALTQDIISAALDGDITPDSGAVSPITVAVTGAQSSQFMVSGYKALSHDGFSVTSSLAQASGTTPGFDEENYGLTIGTRFDGSQLFSAPAGSVTLGVIANYTHTDIDVGAPSGFPDLPGGTADVDSWSLGTYGLVTDGQRYGLLTVTGTYGTPETSTTIVQPISAEFTNFGLATSAMAGVLVPVGADAKLDLRGGLNYVYAQSEDFEDSLGTSFTDGRMEEFSGTVSARLFSVLRSADYTIRPFVQGGLNHRLHYENELKIESETFAFDDADTSVFARAGIDFDVDQSTQAYVAVRGDASEDFEAIAAQVGVTFKLD
jgi:hypothetical protein